MKLRVWRTGDFAGKFPEPIAHNITCHVTSPTAPVVFARKSGKEGETDCTED